RALYLFLYSIISTLHTPFFFFQCYVDHRDLHSFPTRRSSDLPALLHPSDFYSEAYRVIYQAMLELFERGRSSVAKCPASVLRLRDRKSTRLNSSHVAISYAVFCLKKKKIIIIHRCG